MQRDSYNKLQSPDKKRVLPCKAVINKEGRHMASLGFYL